MTRIRILPYKQHSRSAKALSKALGAKVLRLDGSIYKSRPGDVVINWGSSDYPDFLYSLNLNCVPLDRATNKLTFFSTVSSDLVPQFWTRQEDIPDDAFPVVCRTVLNGHSGVGIVIANTRDELVPCQLYVKYVKKQEEYRIHVGKNRDGDIITISQQRKARRIGVDEVNWQVRNHANGFVFVRSNVHPPALALDVAHRCLSETGLDFGAVDVIWNNHQQRAYALEVNTAPGLEGQTITDYVEFFKELTDA